MVTMALHCTSKDDNNLRTPADEASLRGLGVHARSTQISFSTAHHAIRSTSLDTYQLGARATPRRTHRNTLTEKVISQATSDTNSTALRACCRLQTLSNRIKVVGPLPTAQAPSSTVRDSKLRLRLAD